MRKTTSAEWTAYKDQVSTVQGYIQIGFFYKCLLRGISKDLDNFGLLCQPVRMALATRVQMSNLPPLLLPVIAGEYVRARISHVADSNRLFVQLENNAQTILKVSEKLRTLAKQKHERLCNPECGTIIAALYPPDRCYYRASVFSKAGIDFMVVFYIDYGNMASVNIDDAFLLKDAYLLSVPPQAIQLIIEDVRKPRLNLEQIKSLLIDQTVGAQINDVNSNGESFIATLFVKDEKNRNVNLTEVILGERPAPTLPVPKPVAMDNVLDAENRLVDYTCRNNRWKGVCSNDCKKDSFGKQNRGDNRKFSNNFRSSVDRNFNGYSDAAGIGDRRTCRNCGQSGHLAHQCSVYHKIDFTEDKKRNDSGDQRFVNSGDRSLHISKKRNHLPRPFLDRNTHIIDTAADKSGWKSDKWIATPSTNMAKSELNCFLNDGFEKKVDNEKDTENWIVNEGGWEINNAGCELVDNGNQIEASENATATSACSDFVGAGNHKNTEFCIESIELPGNCPINTFGLSLPPNLEVDTGGVDETKTTSNEDLSNYGVKPTEQHNVQFSSFTLSRIESSSLEGIKFGDTIGGLCSDDLTKADPLSFFVQLDRDKNNIEHLVLSNAQLPANLPKLSSFEISQACIAPFMGDYYRAEIIGEVNSNKRRILFVDYGNVEDMDTSVLYVINNSLPEQFYTSRRMAFHCRLYGVMPITSMHTFDLEARKVFSELTADQKLLICFLQQSVKGIYEVTIMLSNGHFVSDILISRGFAIPFKWGIGPSLSLYETLDVLRSDECDHVNHIFTVQLSDSLSQLEQLNDGYVDSKKTIEAPQIGDVVISYFEESPYRAEIIATEINDSNEVYRVRYVDYGNESLCTKEELFALDRDQQPDIILYTPRQGFRCRIDGVQPLTHKEEWPEEVQKRIDNLLAPSTSFEAAVGSPSVDGVYPIRIMVLKNQLIDEDGLGTDEANSMKNKVDLASWLIAKGYAEMQDIWRDYPVKNLLSGGKHEYEMFITEIDGQIIRARPYVFAEQYNRMKKALANIKTVPLETDAPTTLISLNNEYKRAVLISSKNNATSKKYLLVDEGISIEEMPIQFSGISELCDSDGFLVRTCHRLSVQLKLSESLLDEKSTEMIMNSAAMGPVKVILVEYSKDGNYLISDILFSDGTTLLEKFKKTRQEAVDENGSASDLCISDLEQADGNSKQDEKVDSRSPTNGTKRIEYDENLIVPNLKAQV
ncbi:tudor domain-containing protein [Loa loa]|uniref:Tudor domain-containing protein n=1 Tax=Loa loa TaxID=7209 RepID=A0A1S0UKD3_LOALO|nr:tudor domain-containing protein [Loa loa]EJD76035.1 tudor domain-containing protein [Loa loa]